MLFISLLILIVAMALHSKYITPILFTRIVAIIFIYSGALSLNALYIQSIGSGIGIYSGLFHVTTVSQLLDTFIFFIGSLILFAWPSSDYRLSSTHLTVKLTNAAEYSLIVLFSTFGASLLVSSADLISMYLSIELQSFGVYILSTLYRDSESSCSAGLKYFLLGGLSSCLILLGAGIIYSFTGLTNFESIYTIVSVSDSQSITQGLSLGLIIIIVGFLFKIAAAPLHNWAVDVYEDTPTIVTIWLTIMPKISIIIFLLELHSQIGIIGSTESFSSILDILGGVSSIQTNLISVEGKIIAGNTVYVLKNLLLISSLLSLIIGTVVGLAQSRIKRLLTYSTISHIGFILLALAINSEQSIDSLIFYIIQYSITNLNTFLILLALGYIIKSSMDIQSNNKLYYSPLGNKGSKTDIKFISEMKGQFFSNPLLSLSLTVCLFSMAGIPPLMGFFAKQFVLFSAIQSGYYFISIVGIIVSVISASYYLKIIRVLHSTPTTKSDLDVKTNQIESLDGKAVESEEFKHIDKSNYNNSESIITSSHSFLISTLTLSILLFVLKPSILLNSTQLLSLSLFYY
jgi:NADH-ubiquinone oxidoreductase chain 2